MSKLNRQLAIVYRPLASLKPNPRNAKTHSNKQIARLAKSIRSLGFLGAIVIDETGRILAGHARMLAAQSNGMITVPTIQILDLSETQKRAFTLADNKISENGGWDREILAGELGDLAELLVSFDLELSDLGFETGEIDTILFDHEEAKADPVDDLPAVDKTIASISGDLWICGPHRLLCGDAQSSADFERLMDGKVADAMFADPPYNVKIDGHVQGRGKTKHSEFAYASGEMSNHEFESFLHIFMTNAICVSRPGAVHFICMDWRSSGTLSAIGRQLYGSMINWCVWAKSNAGQGSLYRSQHEFVLVFRVGNDAHQNNIELGRYARNRSNLWSYPGGNTFAARSDGISHPTVKPVAMVADALRDCTSKNDLVLDPFCGSGTTILAAEKVGRKAFGIEYEPKYVDLCIRRWQQYTGRDAKLEGDGRCFDEVKAERCAESAKEQSAGGVR